MIRISTLIWLVLSVISGALLFNISQKAQDMQGRLHHMDRKIAHERQSLDILQAEWSYLNRPERLAYLSEKYLDLKHLNNRPLLSADKMIYMKSPADMWTLADSENREGGDILFTNSANIITSLPQLRPRTLERPETASAAPEIRKARRAPYSNAAPHSFQTVLKRMEVN